LSVKINILLLLSPQATSKTKLTKIILKIKSEVPVHDVGA